MIERIAGVTIAVLIGLNALGYAVLIALKIWSKHMDRKLAETRKRVFGRYWMN